MTRLRTLKWGISVILLLIIFSPSGLFAQGTENRKGAKALSFGFDGLDINRFVFGIGGKYWLSENVAIQGSFDLESGRTGKKNTSVARGSGSQGNASDSEYGAGISFGMERHFGHLQSISPYFGAQAKFIKSKSEDTFLDGSSTVEYVFNTTRYGIDAVIGAEYWILDHLSLAGQYTLGISYESSRTKRSFDSSSFESSTNSKDSGHQVGTGTSQLILSLYF